jgi:hypothetical protein
MESLPNLAEKLILLIDEIRLLTASIPIFVGNRKIEKKYPLISWIFAYEPIDSRPLVFLLGLGFTVAVLSVPLTWLIVRRHSRGAMHFFWLVLLSLFVYPIGISGLGAATNSLFDTSRPQEQYVIVMADPEYCSRDRHRVSVQDLPNRQRSFKIRLRNLTLCDATNRGDTLVVVVHEGLWGWPWISGVQRPRAAPR